MSAQPPPRAAAPQRPANVDATIVSPPTAAAPQRRANVDATIVSPPTAFAATMAASAPDDPFLKAAAEAAREADGAGDDPFSRPPAPDAAVEPERPHWKAAAAAVARDGRRGLDLLTQAARSYRAQVKPLLLVAALLFMPAAFVKSCVVASVTGPVIAARVAAAEQAEQADKAELQSDVVARRAALARGGFELGLRKAIGRFISGLVGGLALVLVFAGIGLTLAGSSEAGWQEIGSQALRQLPALSALTVPVAIVSAGMALWVVPGMIAAWVVLYTPALALDEKLVGTPALRRSLALAKGAPGATGVLVLALFLAIGVSHGLAGLLTPDSGKRAAVFLTLLFGDLLLVAALPPIALAWLQLGADRRRAAATSR